MTSIQTLIIVPDTKHLSILGTTTKQIEGPIAIYVKDFSLSDIVSSYSIVMKGNVI